MFPIKDPPKHIKQSTMETAISKAESAIAALSAKSLIMIEYCRRDTANEVTNQLSTMNISDEEEEKEVKS